MSIDLSEHFDPNGHMQPEITGPESFWVVTTEYGGDVFLPCDVHGEDDILREAGIEEGEPAECRMLLNHYGARMTAPGYLDSSEWCAFDTYEAAAEYLCETYGQDTRWRVKHIAHSGMVNSNELYDTKGEARTVIAEKLREARRNGVSQIIKHDSPSGSEDLAEEWEVTEPEDCALVPDYAGFICLTREWA